MILEHNELSIIFDHLTSNTLVLFDVDNTLIRNQHALGTPEWVPHFQEQKRSAGLSLIEAAQETLALYLAINRVAHVSLIDEKAPQVIESLKKVAGVSILTARENSLIDVTCRQLNILELEVSTHWQDKKDLLLTTSSKGSFAQGMIFTGGAHKGHCLVEVLNYTEATPEKIIFIDDQEKSLWEVSEVLKGLNTEFLGIRYSNLDAHVAALNPDICAFQLEHFQRHQTLLTNEEAAQRIKAQKT